MKISMLLMVFLSFTFSQARADTRDWEPLLKRADELGAPIEAVKRAIRLSQGEGFSRHDVFAVFDISQPSKNKRLYVFDVRNNLVKNYFVAHGKSNGDNFRATRFRGFQNDHNMTPLGPLRTGAATTDMEHYASVVDKYTGERWDGLTTLWLEGTTSYNSYINNTFDGGARVVWIVHPAWYMTAGFRKNMPDGLGRSLGCLALDPVVNNEVANKLKGKALVYVTVGNDPIEDYL